MPRRRNPPRQAPPIVHPPIVHPPAPEYGVNAILGTRSTDRGPEYLIRWEPSWEPAQNLAADITTYNVIPTLPSPTPSPEKRLAETKEVCIEIPQQRAITKDNVQLDIDAVLYVRVTDPYKTTYGVRHPEYAISELAQTVTHAEIGKLMLANVFRQRANLNIAIVEGIKESAAPSGLICLRYEIRTMIQCSIKQFNTERKKRAMILESERICEAENNVENEKRARILRPEVQMHEQVNKSQGLPKAADAEKIQRIFQTEAEMQSQVNKSALSEKRARILRSGAQIREQVNKSQGSAAEAGKILRIFQTEAEMQSQFNKSTERKKRGMILESEGICDAEKNNPLGEKRARIPHSEMEMQSPINKSIALAKSAESEKESRIVLAQADEQVQILRDQGLAKSIELESEARTNALERMAPNLGHAEGANPASFVTADNNVNAFGNLAKESNTVIVPPNPANIDETSQARAGKTPGPSDPPDPINNKKPKNRGRLRRMTFSQRKKVQRAEQK